MAEIEMGEDIVLQNKEKETDNDKAMLKRISEIKELMEKNAALQTVVEEEPRRVLSKMYIEGTPNNLKNIANNIISSYQYDSGGQTIKRTLAITLMIEDITPEEDKKKK